MFIYGYKEGFSTKINIFIESFHFGTKAAQFRVAALSVKRDQEIEPCLMALFVQAFFFSLKHVL